jgi:hypothetical protein
MRSVNNTRLNLKKVEEVEKEDASMIALLRTETEVVKRRKLDNLTALHKGAGSFTNASRTSTKNPLLAC